MNDRHISKALVHNWMPKIEPLLDNLAARIGWNTVLLFLCDVKSAAQSSRRVDLCRVAVSLFRRAPLGRDNPTIDLFRYQAMCNRAAQCKRLRFSQESLDPQTAKVLSTDEFTLRGNVRIGKFGWPWNALGAAEANNFSRSTKAIWIMVIYARTERSVQVDEELARWLLQFQGKYRGAKSSTELEKLRHAVKLALLRPRYSVDC
jgi:hypothetical protein